MKWLLCGSKLNMDAVSKKTLHERLLVFLGGLLGFSALAAVYFYSSHVEISRLAEKVGVVHRLSIESALLYDELIHTQLEIAQLSQNRAQSMADDIAEIQKYEQSLEKRLEQVHDTASQHSDFISSDMLGRIKHVHKMYPVLKEVWKGYVTIVQSGKSSLAPQEAYRGVSDVFDEMGFNRLIQDIVNSGVQLSNESEARIRLVANRQQAVMFSCVTLIFFLSMVVFSLHRKAVQGQLHEIQLAHASKLASLGEMSAGVAHEVNTPLMFIKGYNNRVRSSLLQANFEPASPVWQYLTKVDDGVSRITRIVRHFRDFSRMSHSKEMEFRSLNEIVENAFILLNERLHMNGIDVRKELDKTCPIVLCDADRLEQVVINLLNNAVDALCEGSSRGKYILVRSSVEGDKVALYFEDNGVGISTEVQSRVFDPFFTTKPIGKGTGLGLSISQGIIRDHQGTISVSSRPGVPTCFTIRLPLYRTAEHDNLQKSKSAA